MELGIAYYGAYLPEHLEKDFRNIRDSFCDYVVITISENDMCYFPGKWQLAPKIAHDQGLEIFAVLWGFGSTFGGGRISKLLTEYSEVFQIDQNGKIIGAGCFNNPLFRKTYVDYVEKISHYGYDGYLIDEPTPNNCYCPACQRKYKDKYNEDLSADSSHIHAFRVESTLDFIREVSRNVKSLAEGALISIAVMPQDKSLWNKIAGIEDIDIFGTDPYWLPMGKDISFLVDTSKEALNVCKKYKKTSEIWINCWKIPQGKEEEIYEGTLKIARLAPDKISAWSYKGGMGTNETSDDPLSAWSQLVKAYKKIRQNQ